MKKLSIITTTYNQYSSLRKLYESIVAQKDYCYEWVIVDDGSTDETEVNVTLWTKDNTIRIVYLRQQNEGLALTKHFNKCVKAASGDIIFQVFGDSYLSENTLGLIHKTFKKGTAGSICRINVGADGVVISRDWRVQDSIADQIIPLMQTPYPWTALAGNGMLVWKKDLKRIGYADEKYFGYGRDDYDTFMRLAMNGVHLYMYNNINLYHKYHVEKEDSTENMKRYLDKIQGKGYMSQAQTVVLDFDDFSLENNNLYYLDKLKEYYPNLKVSMFMIPWDYQYYSRIMDFQREEAVKMIKDRLSWIELIPHGLSHSPREFENVEYKDLDVIFKGIDEVFKHYDLPYVKGFKAPQWLYNKDLVKYLDEKGWFLAVDRNQPESPRTKRHYIYSHSIDEPYWLSQDKTLKLHGHISLPSSNNLPDNMLNLLKINNDANFKFISEII